MARTICKMMAGKICLSTAALAEILKVDPRTIQEWGERGCPKAARGWWPVSDVLVWRGVIGSGGLNTEEDVEKQSWNQKKVEFEARFKEQKANEAEFKNEILRGEYLRKEDVTAELQRFFVVLKRSMLGYSRRIATDLSAYVDPITARRIEKSVTELTLDALEQISIDGVYKPRKKKTST